jgi:putative ABC transport system substrate-binding protein
MRRRERLLLLATGMMGARPLRAQQKAMPVIGFLGVSTLEKMGGGVLLDFKRGLAESGYVEDHNVRIEYRWAEDHYDRLSALAIELVQRHVTVLAAPGSPAALPAKAATAIIPIVFMIGSDPVQLGLVASLNRPGYLATLDRQLYQPRSDRSVRRRRARLGLIRPFTTEANHRDLLEIPNLDQAGDASGLPFSTT